jgi:hypothetical protein
MRPTRQSKLGQGIKPSARAQLRTRPPTADEVQTHGFTALRLPRLQQAARRVIPTEPIFVHGACLLPLVNSYPSLSERGTVVSLSFAGTSMAIYWLALKFLRRSGLLRRLWEEQVLDVRRSRVSVGTLISLADHFHILLAFSGLFLYAVNGIFVLGEGRSWQASLYTGLMAFNLKGFDDHQTVTEPMVRAICLALSLLNTLFVGFFAAAFLKPFLQVFGHK